MKNLIITIILLFCFININSCAPTLVQNPVNLEPASGEKEVIVIQKDVKIELPSGYSRTLLSQSRWELFGVIPEGRVYKPLTQTFTIEGANIHEAYLVVSYKKLRGFYLPAKKSYSPLKSEIELPIS